MQCYQHSELIKSWIKAFSLNMRVSVCGQWVMTNWYSPYIGNFLLLVSKTPILRLCTDSLHLFQVGHDTVSDALPLQIHLWRGNLYGCMCLNELDQYCRHGRTGRLPSTLLDMEGVSPWESRINELCYIWVIIQPITLHMTYSKVYWSCSFVYTGLCDGKVFNSKALCKQMYRMEDAKDKLIHDRIYYLVCQ